MNKIVAIHQPNYLPWLGYFDKIQRSDIFVFMDNVQYSRGTWINRCQLKNNEGKQWLTIPVITAGVFGQKIKEAKIDYKTDWISSHLGAMETNYKKAPYFDKYYPYIKEILEQKIENLADLNMKLIKKIAELLKFKTKFIKGSELNVVGNATDLLINIVRATGGDSYLCGGGAEGYQEDAKFAENGLKLIYQNFKHPVYKQMFEGFIPGLSIIDYLFNKGNELINYGK
ncbi:MAG: WbqC family protein [Candidatus Pacebacteria bacterium]|nr:WbqC family protein [Candidatus Paceibacterota bacterium]